MARGTRQAETGGMEPWVLLAVTLTFLALFPFLRNELVKRRLHCPVKDTDADVRVVQRHNEPTKPVRVRSCDLLPNPRRVGCSQACLEQLAQH